MTSELHIIKDDFEIICSRIINAPRVRVYQAWSDPRHLEIWWGPAGFTNTFQEFDFRVGGKWRFIMHGPDKGNHLNECEFTEIKEPSLIAWKRFSKPIFQVIVTLEEKAPDKTKVISRQIFESAEICRKVRTFAVDKNEENFDRLEAELGRMSSKSAPTDFQAKNSLGTG